jgi:FixJ family two-component response regulator
MSNRGGLVYVVDDDAGVHDAVADLIRSAGLIAETLASGMSS